MPRAKAKPDVDSLPKRSRTAKPRDKKKGHGPAFQSIDEIPPPPRANRVPVEHEAMMINEDGIVVPYKPLNGRDRIVLTVEEIGKLKGMLAVGCNVRDCSLLLGVSLDVLMARYKQVIEEARAEANATLRRWQWESAKNGNTTMLIWLGKQRLGQRDQLVVGEDPDNPFAVDAANRPVLNIHFVTSDGDGGISEEEQQRLAELESKTIDALSIGVEG